MKRCVIVDGYNLLGVRERGFSAGNFMTETARERLILELSGYHQRKGLAVTLVFDGWRDGLASEQREWRSGVEVIYSRRGERADQVIDRLAQELGRACAVVSSDREVSRRARAAGAFVMGSQEFALRLMEAVRPAPLPSDRREEEARPRRAPEKKGNPRKLPKAVRARQRKLKGF